MTNSIGELDTMGKGDLIFVIGTNTTACHPIIGVGMLAAVQRGARLIVADPRAITLTQHADLWLRLNPGSDLALLNGLAHVIVARGLEDASYIARHVAEFDAFKALLEVYTPDCVASITGVSPQDIITAAQLMAEADNMSIYYTMGITQHITGVDNVTAVSNLALLTGNIGRPKTGVNPLRGQNNVQGACDMGALPDVFPGYQKVRNKAVRTSFETSWGVSLPTAPGLTVPSVFEAIEHDQVKAVYVFGENPIRSDPDANHVQHCLEDLDFLVVQDIFMTETAHMADVVLPGACFAEKDGTFTSTERRVQRIRKAVDPCGDALPDWKILTDILNRLGVPAPYDHPSQIFDEMCTLTPTYGGITYQRLETEALQWPCPSENHPGTPVLHADGPISGTAAFAPSHYRSPAEMPDEQYPLMLTTGRVVTHYHTGTMTQMCWGLHGADPQERAEINPEDAEKAGIEDGDAIRVSSRRGSVECCAKLTERVPQGLVFMTFHFSESSGNMLTISACDPVTQTPELKICSITIEKIFPRLRSTTRGSKECNYHA